MLSRVPWLGQPMQFDQLKRREFITLLGGAAAWPLAARAQQPAMPVIGLLSAAGQPTLATAGALKGLAETGYVPNRNVAIEMRVTDRYEQLPALAAELVRRRVAVILALGSANSAQAAKAATSTIPIVFANGSDPVEMGLVASRNRPGGNVTGVTFLSGTLGAKRLEIIRELVPQASTIAFLVNPTNARIALDREDMQLAARSIGQHILSLTASTPSELDAAFAAAAGQQVSALVVNGDAYFNSRTPQLVALAARHRIPTTYPVRTAVEAGGLVSYGDDRLES